MELEKERWRKIKDYENYLISSYGRVYVKTRFTFSNRHKANINLKAKFMKTYTNARGYEAITLKGKPMLVHRLVGIAFVKNPNNKPEINHINGIKNYNYYKNLEWCTRKENAIHAHKTGLQVAIRGKEHYMTNLTDKEIVEIKSFLRDNTNKGFSKMLAERYNISPATVSAIKNEKNWKHIKI